MRQHHLLAVAMWRSIFGGPSSRLTNNSVMRPSCIKWAAVSEPLPERSSTATECSSSTATDAPGARGETLTRPSAAAVARKKTGCFAMNAAS
eukprot:CAMPEP_0185387742 /NCGR_PEP_ID=MMETSP1364-20130426/66903_1 /TAXON_ID=38817 /ORGANISM="Gephyrocapsa oceanica, Strain RCC1303" /LENGTH=91 /DNA_ID=CAMNT_0027989643 /DNA_START=126 /DNA_END=399 /DNA_ORIENTATION=+